MRQYQLWAQPYLFEDSEDVNAADECVPFYFTAYDDQNALYCVEDIKEGTIGNLHEVESDTLGNKYCIRLIDKWGF